MILHAALRAAEKDRTVSSDLHGQISTKLRYCKVCNFGAGWCQPFFELAVKHWGLAKTASVINYSSNQPARHMAWLTGLLSLLSNQSSSASLSPSDYNCGATLIPTGVVRIQFFPLNLQFGEASGDAPV